MVWNFFFFSFQKYHSSLQANSICDLEGIAPSPQNFPGEKDEWPS